MFETLERKPQNYSLGRSLLGSFTLHASFAAFIATYGSLSLGPQKQARDKIQIVSLDDFVTDFNPNVDLSLESLSAGKESKFTLPQALESDVLGIGNNNLSSNTAYPNDPRTRYGKTPENSPLSNSDESLRSLKIMVDFLDYFSTGQGSLEGIYTNYYPKGKRDQKSIEDFFLAYANTYLLHNKDWQITIPIERMNMDIDDPMYITAQFDENGIISIVSMQLNPSFEDPNGEYLSYFRIILDKMPKNFISSKMCECKLPLPFVSEYQTRNGAKALDAISKNVDGLIKMADDSKK